MAHLFLSQSGMDHFWQADGGDVVRLADRVLCAGQGIRRGLFLLPKNVCIASERFWHSRKVSGSAIRAKLRRRNVPRVAHPTSLDAAQSRRLKRRLRRQNAFARVAATALAS